MSTLTDQAIKKKFEVLLQQSPAFLSSPANYNASQAVLFKQWKTQVTNLIEKVCGPNSVHFKAVLDLNFAFTEPQDLLGILQAAHADYSDGFLSEIRYLIRADLLDDFLSQAEALNQNGYHAAAASLAGAVLEDTLRKLCDKHGVTYDPAKTNIEALNVELARKTVYDNLVKKEITAKGHLRNEADHGHFGNVKAADVEDMLRWVRRFAQEYLK